MMGKPSRTRLSKRQSSEESILRPNNQMSGIKNIPKMGALSKKKRRRTKKKIKKLFDKLRDNSNITIDSSQNSTVILLNDTVAPCSNEASPNNKRKHSDSSFIEQNKCTKIDDSESVIISDDTIIINNKASSSKHDDVIITTTDYGGNDVIITKSHTLTDDNDIVITDSNLKKKDVQVSNVWGPRLNTPKKLFAPPMNCSTPLSKSHILSTSIPMNNNAETAQNFNNATKEINRDSFLTIDLTTETDPNKSGVSKTMSNTVIDVDNTEDSQDCTFVSISNTSLSMSGDSDVTVLRNTSNRKKMNKFVNGIAQLDASEKGRLLEMITQKIFSGCKIPERVTSKISSIRQSVNKHTETAEDSYIKEVILGQKLSRNSIGSNIYNPSKDLNNKTGLRMIVIDGSNVAMQHGKGRVFSVEGLQICIDYFVKRGHVVKAFVPRFRCKYGKSTMPRALDALERRGLVVYTPSREIQGRMVASYDDRYIVQCAAEFDGVIVSGDNYRDLLQENPRWRFVIENRLLPFTWVNDMIMFPKDPLGRNGPTLEVFLRHPVKPVASIVL